MEQLNADIYDVMMNHIKLEIGENPVNKEAITENDTLIQECVKKTVDFMTTYIAKIKRRSMQGGCLCR